MNQEPFLYRLRLRNYKSIGSCDVRLGNLSLLVGRNGSGKSNFLDAIKFISDGLQNSLDHAIKSRGGIDEVRRRSTGHPHNFSIEAEINLQELSTAIYSFEIAAQRSGGFIVKREELRIRKPNGDVQFSFVVTEGEVRSNEMERMPPAAPDRLYLVSASGLPQFRAVYDAFLAMGFYNLNPQQMKEIQSPEPGELLRRDGSNIASVVARLSADEPERKNRINDYLKLIVPDVVDFQRIPLGHRETLRFQQNVRGSKHPWYFYASSMSDGTLRALGILVATMQLADRASSVRLVGIEEPETALHPAAAGALIGALREAAEKTQVLVTTHSPELLDEFDETTDDLFVVQAEKGETLIAPADPASKNAIRDHLFTAGELLRKDQLQPDRTAQLLLNPAEEGP